MHIFLTIGLLTAHRLVTDPLLTLGMLLIVVGVQFFSVGLLGEFMAHNTHDNDEYRIKDQK